MIPVPSGVRVWIATGHTDMRRGMNSLALLVQEALQARSARRRSLRVPRQERQADQDPLARRPRHVALRQAAGAWPVHLAVRPADGAVVITPAQLGYMLEGIDWRNPHSQLAAARRRVER